MDEMLRSSMADFFDVGEFAEYLGVTVDDLIAAFPDEVFEALPDLKELMEYEEIGSDNDN